MSDRPESGVVRVEVAQALLQGAMRGNALAVWREAAEIAEDFAAQMEAETLPALNGPAALLYLAVFFRRVAEGLSEDDAPSANLG